MTVIDSGHEYVLDSIDGEAPQRLVFVKRQGDKYPGNVGCHAGTTSQEVLRALIERATYVNRQMPCPETSEATALLIRVVWLFESRAARLHGRAAPSVEAAVLGCDRCRACGHVGCGGDCRSQAAAPAPARGLFGGGEEG
jgi:hypothetical protein